MLRQQFMSAELYYEFKKLSKGVEISIHSTFKISAFLLKRAKKIFLDFFWLFMESPKLWEKIGPDKSRELEALKEYRPYIHPPSLKF